MTQKKKQKEKLIHIPCYFGKAKKPEFTLHWRPTRWRLFKHLARERGKTPSELACSIILDAAENSAREHGKAVAA